jgi:hypothetical protein
VKTFDDRFESTFDYSAQCCFHRWNRDPSKRCVRLLYGQLRTLENTGDPAVARKLGLHKDLRTTQSDLHARRARVWAAAARLNRK